MKRDPLSYFFLAFLLGLVVLACARWTQGIGVKPVEAEGRLIVATKNSGASYFKDQAGNSQGFEYELVQSFAQDKQLDVEFLVFDTAEEVLEALRDGKAHMAAAGISITEEREEEFRFSPSYMRVSQKVVCSKPRNVSRLDDLEDLNIVVSSGTSQQERMQELSDELPGFDFKIVSDNSELLLRKVAEREDICTVIDENLLRVNWPLYPQLRVVHSFARDADDLAWAVAKEFVWLQKQLKDWFSVRGRIASENLQNKYRSDQHRFDRVNMSAFFRAVREELPKLKEMFVEVSRDHNFDWRLIAAIAYQESKWDPKARSPTGVRGLMMLTQRTAREMGVRDRLDARQSLEGGVKYLSELMRRVPDYVLEEDRIWFALAAYNVGLFHLRDALSLTVLENKDPRSWADVSTVLPLLSQAKYHSKTRFGYARGMEPVLFVSRIQRYHRALKKKSRSLR